MRMTFAALALATGALSTSAALAQGTSLAFKLDDTDLAYARNPGYTYEIVTITVTDAAGFRLDASGVTQTGTNTVRRLEYVVFPVGVPVPAGVNDYSNHRNDPEAVARRREVNPNTSGPRALRDGPSATPFTEGEYQLVVAAQDRNGSRGDVAFQLDLIGGFYGVVLAAPPPVGSVGMTELAAATAGASQLLTRSAHGVARDQARASFAARGSALNFARDEGAPLVTASSRGEAPGLTGNLYAWAELTGFYGQDDANNRDFRGAGLQIGADVAVRPDMVVGLSVGVEEVSSSAIAADTDGTMVFVQPYLAYRSGEWHGEATLIIGRGDFDQSGAGGAGSGETDFAALTFEGAYDIARGNGRVMTPTFGAIWGREEVTGTGGVLAGTGTTRVDFGQLSAGARLTQVTENGSFFGGLHADWSFSDSDTVLVSEALVDDGLSARVEFGGTMDFTNGNSLDTSFEIGGLGSDVTNISGALRVTFRF